ncbi:MAG: hypothetical protein JXA19_06715 [Anaerolineales bacterium]|nr:hypothetical protein [Anaerolineales bacterium]
MTKSVFSAIIAGVSGFLVIIGYYFPNSFIGEIRNQILSVAVFLVAILFLIGISNLLKVHLQKINAEGDQYFYSIAVVAMFIMTFVLTLISKSEFGYFIFNAIQIPIETSLMAVISFGLVVVLSRILQNNLSITKFVFLAFVIVTILMAGPLRNTPLLKGLLNTNIWAEGGMRGILIGVGLGTVSTGIRVLIGVDRPYGK